jgi:segregation and condensation protein B
MSLKAKIEAVLFLTAKPIKAQALARIVNADVQAVRQAILELVHDYEERQGGLEIADDDGYSFQVKDEYASLMDEFLPVEMTAALIRTLSAIAIKQPISQSDIIRIRGAGAYEHIKELVNRELIAKKEDEAGGRSPILSTTKKFQEYFRLTKDGKELRNYLKKQVRKLTAAEQAAQAAGQLVIPEVVSNAETDNELNNRIFLETADLDEAAEVAEAAESVGVGGSGQADGAVAEVAASAELLASPADVTGSVEPEETFVASAAPPAVAEPLVSAAAVAELPAPPAVAEPVVSAEAIAELPAPPVAVDESAVGAGELVESVAPPAANAEVSAKPAGKRAQRPADTLSKLAAAASTSEPKPLDAHEKSASADQREAEVTNFAPDEGEAVTCEASKSSVQAHAAKRGPAIGNSKKKSPPQLSDLLRKQKELEEALKRARLGQVEQGTIDFTPPSGTAEPNEKLRPS